MRRSNIVILMGIIISTACNSNTPAKPQASDSIAVSPNAAPVPGGTPAEGGAVETDTSTTAVASVDKSEKKYTSEKGDVITAVYHNSGDMGIVVLNKDGESIKLMKDAKKEGATIYTNGKINWKIKGNEASFEKDNVVSVYTESK